MNYPGVMVTGVLHNGKSPCGTPTHSVVWKPTSMDSVWAWPGIQGILIWLVITMDLLWLLVMCNGKGLFNQSLVTLSCISLVPLLW